MTRTHTYTERERKDSTLGSLTSSSSRTRCPDGRRFEPRLPGEGGRGERSKDRRSLRLRRGRTEGTREGRMQAAARTDALSVRQGRGAHPSKRLLSRRHGVGREQSSSPSSLSFSVPTPLPPPPLSRPLSWSGSEASSSSFAVCSREEEG